MSKPNRKVTTSALAGAITTIVVGILRQVGIEFSMEMTSALTTIIMVVVAYFVPEPQSKETP